MPSDSFPSLTPTLLALVLSQDGRGRKRERKIHSEDFPACAGMAGEGGVPIHPVHFLVEAGWVLLIALLPGDHAQLYCHFYP